MSNRPTKLGQEFLAAVDKPVWNALHDSTVPDLTRAIPEHAPALNEACQALIAKSLIAEKPLFWLERVSQWGIRGRRDVPLQVNSGADIARMVLRAGRFSGDFNREAFAASMIENFKDVDKGAITRVADAIADGILKVSGGSIDRANFATRMSGQVHTPSPVCVKLWDQACVIRLSGAKGTGIKLEKVPLPRRWENNLG